MPNMQSFVKVINPTIFVSTGLIISSSMQVVTNYECEILCRRISGIQKRMGFTEIFVQRFIFFCYSGDGQGEVLKVAK